MGHLQIAVHPEVIAIGFAALAIAGFRLIFPDGPSQSIWLSFASI